MKYIEINIEVNFDGIEPVVGALLAMGIENTVVEDPRDVESLMANKQTYQWDYLDDSIVEKMKETPKVTVYLDDNEEGRQSVMQIKEMLKSLKTEEKAGAYGDNVDFGSFDTVVKIDDDADWKDKWKEYFKPAKISEHIMVCPSWEECTPPEGVKILNLDPGMAFGTGTHETTSMCVKMLEKYIPKVNTEAKILDVGCGSGILSVAAGLLGAAEILAVDIDPDAVTASKENIAKNHLEDKVTARFGDLTKGVEFSAHIVVANLMADLVIMLSKDVCRHLEPHGYFISSGILNEKEDVVASAIKEAGFELVEICREGGWSCIVACAEA